MGIRFRCQACSNKVNVKDFLAGKRGICPKCGTRFIIPEQSEPEFQTAAEEPEPESVPTPAAAPANAPRSPNTPANGMPVAAPIATAAVVGHSPLTSSASAYVAPGMPIPGFQAAPPAGPRDPFQEAPAAQWYVRHTSGQQYGPAPVPIMQKWLSEGRVPGDGMVWRDDWSDWQMASFVFPQLSSPPVAAARGLGTATYPPGITPRPAVQAPAAVNDPFAFDTAPASGPSSPASQFIHQRRDNSRMMLIISIVLLFAIALVGGVLFYVLTRPKATEDVAIEQLLSPPSLTEGIEIVV